MTGAHSYSSWSESKTEEVGPEAVESSVGKYQLMNISDAARGG